MRAPRRLAISVAAVLALPAGALAAGVLPASDLATHTPTGETDVSPSLQPVIDPVAGLAAVGRDGGSPIAAVRRPFGGPVVGGPAQEAGEIEVGPQLVAPDGTITALWSSRHNPALHAARLAPGASAWAAVGVVPDAAIGTRGAVVAADGTITALTFDDAATPPTIVARTLAPGAADWAPATPVATLPAGTSIDESDGPQVVRSAAGVVAAAWGEQQPGTGDDVTNKVGVALQAVDGTWPTKAQDVLGQTGASFVLGGLAVPDGGRSARVVVTRFAAVAPQERVAAEQITDDGPVPMNGVPAPPQGDGSLQAVGAAFTPDGTLRIVGLRTGGLSESDVPPTHNGQVPGAPYAIVDDPGVRQPTLARLPDGGLLLSYASESGTPAAQSVRLSSRPVGANAWSAPQQLQAPVPANGGGVRIGGVATDPAGDAYVTWSTLTSTKAALSGAVVDATKPIVGGLTLPTAAAGAPVQLGIDEHDAWSSTATQWSLGDGAAASGDAPTHVYDTPGVRTVTATVADAAGNATTTSGALTVTAPAPPTTTQTGSPTPPATTNVAPPAPRPPSASPDRVGPRVAITAPTCPKRSSRARCRRRRATAAAWHTVRGTVADAGGVASVALRGTSGSGRRCVVLATHGRRKRAPCAQAAQLHATVAGGHWAVRAPGLATGTWTLAVTATDRAGNATTVHRRLQLAR